MGKTTSSGPGTGSSASSSSCSECKTDSNFSTEIVAFCQKEAFKTYVRNAVNDQMFWRDILQQLQIDNQVKTALANANISGQVQGHLDRANITQRVREQVDDKLKAQISGLVVTELLKALPNMLRDNAQMQQILGQHSAELTVQLGEVARQHLEQIVNEDQYHQVHQAFFNAVDQRANDAIAQFNQKGNQAIAQMKADCQANLQQFNQQMGQVGTCLGDVSNLKKDVADLRRQNEKLETEGTVTFWGWMITSVALGSTLAYLLATRR